MPTGITFTDEFIPVMSEQLHREPGADTNWDQFVVELTDFGRQPGDTIRVEAPEFLAEGSDPDTDCKLASIGHKVSANAVETFVMNKQEIQLNEYLKPNPMQLKEYEVKHTIHDLAMINGGVLARHYFQWRNALIRKRFTSSTFVRYANNLAANTITATDYFDMDDFTQAAAVLAKRFIPRYPDGNYIAVIDDGVIATLFQDQKVLDATTRGLASQAFVFRGEIGPYAGIRFVRDNSIPAVTGLGSGSNLTGTQAIMFGTSTLGLQPMGSADGLISAGRMEFYGGAASPVMAGPVVVVNGMPVEVRFNELTDFGRFQEVIWIEHSAYSVLDPKPGSGKSVGTDSRFIQKLVGMTVA